ncbi:hypothetical protein ACWGST_06075 [Agromyces sp. NPDC055520]
MIDALQDFAASLPSFLQWFGVVLVGAIPFVDSYFGAVIGVLIGLPTAVAIGAAVVGNIASMLIFVMTAHGVRGKVVAGKAKAGAATAGRTAAPTPVAGTTTAGTATARTAAIGTATVGDATTGDTAVDTLSTAPAESPRREKLRRVFDKYGVAGVSLVGPAILPSQFTSAAMVSFGANRNTVIVWQTVSIVLWGTVFGVLASLGVSLSR